MPRKGLDREQVLDAAANLADREGLSSLTLARLAAELKIKPPSLYNHIESLEQLQDGLTERGLKDLLNMTRDSVAGRSGREALIGLAHAHRTYASKHPGLYAATQLPVKRLGPASASVAESYLNVVLSALRGYGLEGEAALHHVRILRSALRGFIDLELGGGFGMPLHIDQTFEMMLDTLDAGLSRSQKAD